MRSLYALLAAFLALPLAAQQPAVTPTTGVNPDGSVTFRYTNGGAQAVSVETDAVPRPLTMQKGENGLWTASTPPLKPEHYGYSFRVDGVRMLDPLNHTIRPNIVDLYSDVLVPGSPPAAWEMTAVPHGDVDKHMYTTRIAQNLPENQEPYLVYTPPHYDPKRAGGYPVLYLLHGWSDSEVGWTAVGRAQYMLDAMLAEKRIVPMIVVMPMGYGDYRFVTSGHDVWSDAARVDDNVSRFSDMLVEEIIPAVERDYNVTRDRDHRAIAGLSMGGLESLTVGLTHHELFSYVIGMSSALHNGNFDQHFPALAAGNAGSGTNLKLLWVGCGTEDALLAPNRDFIAWAKGKGMRVTAVEIPGQHTWLVWRQNLLTFAPLLFR